MKAAPAIMCLALLTPTAAHAVSLQNKDSSSYDIKVKSSSSTMTSSINGGVIKNNICSSCTIEVEGVGTVDASGSDKVVIDGGKLSVK
jgi:hypothetical protein